MKRRIKLTVAYDGTDYHGWQIQPNAKTIEEVLNETISQVTRENIKVIGASRTDSGVHALGQVVVFDTECTIPTEKMPIAINTKLPDDIVINDAIEVDKDFHPRYGKISKTYEYIIWRNKISNPLRNRYTCYHYFPLDVEKMKEATTYLIGEHDFASFASAKGNVKSTVRQIYSIEIEENGDEIKFVFNGNGFLYHMIRLIMGVLIKVGDGYYPPIEVKKILDKKELGYAKPTAPAKGLCLVNIDYK